MRYTANKKYGYGEKYFGFTLATWVEHGHEYNVRENGWWKYKLHPGQYGYDNLAVSFARVFEAVDKDKDLLYNPEKIAEIIHDGWTENYLHWRENKPWDADSFYQKPNKPINDKRRNMLADTTYAKLPIDEKEKDLILADFLVHNLKLKLGLDEYRRINV